MPPAPPFPSQNGPANNALFPALYLYPLNDTWAPKHIALTSQHTKIGRQTSSKTAPGERNGFFDSKVLSRQHAEVWEEGGKIFIKDVKSSNGTFINGERLSSEGHESEPFELKSDDIVEFGIDIVGEDNKTIIHHKVAARVVCVFSEQDAQVAARVEQHQQQQLQQHQYLQQQQQQQHLQNQQHPSQHSNQQNQHQPGAGPSVNGGIPAAQNFQFAAQRRAHIAQQGLGSMGGMRPPGKTGLSFDVILSRLQGEVQKSRETGAELNSLSGSMNEIHDTLGGALPTTLPLFPTHLPPVRPPQEAPAPPPAAAPSQATGRSPSLSSELAPGSTSAPSDVASTTSTTGANNSSDAAAVVSEIQSQLRETQSSLAVHLDKVRALEGVLAEQEVIRREVGALRELVEEKRRSSAIERKHDPQYDHDRDDDRHHEEEEEDDDDDDARSVATTMPHELERVDEEDEEQLAAEARDDEERLRDHDRLEAEDADMEHDGEEDHFRPREPHHEDDELLSEQERREIALRREEDARMEAEALAVAAAVGIREDAEVGGKTAAEAAADAERIAVSGEEDAEERRREDLGVGRPHTPEPTRMGLLNARRRSLSSPLSQVSTSEFRHDEEGDNCYPDPAPKAASKSKSPAPTPSKVVDENVHEQVQRLAKQVGAVLALTTNLEAQHATAQGTILALESKVSALEAMLRSAEETLKGHGLSSSASTAASPSSAEPKEKESITTLLAAWKTSVEGQWGSVQQEWNLERERLARAREEWEARKQEWETRKGDWDTREDKWATRGTEWDTRIAGFEGAKGVHSVLAEHQTAIRDLQQQQHATSSTGGVAEMRMGNGDVILKHNGGLVTPPSPRSQSSDSGRYGGRRRRRRSSASRGRESRSHSRQSDRQFVDEPSTTLEDTSVSSAIHHASHGIASGLGMVAAAAAGSVGVHIAGAAERSLATPEPSVYSSIGSLDGKVMAGSTASSPTKSKVDPATRKNTDDMDPATLFQSAASTDLDRGPTGNGHAQGPLVPLNVQAAMGVVLLSVAAAAVFWKVAPE